MSADSMNRKLDRMHRAAPVLLCLIVMLVCLVGVTPAGATALDPDDQAQFEERVYIVQMAEPAALSGSMALRASGRLWMTVVTGPSISTRTVMGNLPFQA